MDDVAIQVCGRGFTAGLVARHGKVVSVAPILRRHIPIGSTGQHVADMCKANGWTWQRCEDIPGEIEAAKADAGVAAILAAFPGAEVLSCKPIAPGAAIRAQLGDRRPMGEGHTL